MLFWRIRGWWTFLADFDHQKCISFSSMSKNQKGHNKSTICVSLIAIKLTNMGLYSLITQIKTSAVLHCCFSSHKTCSLCLVICSASKLCNPVVEGVMVMNRNIFFPVQLSPPDERHHANHRGDSLTFNIQHLIHVMTDKLNCFLHFGLPLKDTVG